MNKCYNFQLYTFENAIFEKNIDATYIIHLVNNGRIENIKNQISKYKTTKKIYILNNFGFKKCKKKLFKQKTNYDLVDAFLKIFEHAKIMNYDNILILEDDFIIDNELKNIKNVYEIDNFLEKKKNKEFIYLLGTVPYNLIPYDIYNYKVPNSLGTHAVIYSKMLRNKIIKLNKDKIDDWDKLFTGYKNKYCFYKPLIYQLFTDTDNSKNWASITNYFNIKKNKLDNINLKYFKFLNMDKNPVIGFNLHYNLCKIYYYLLVLILIVLLYYILIKFQK